jgi:hypothetical protein
VTDLPICRQIVSSLTLSTEPITDKEAVRARARARTHARTHARMRNGKSALRASAGARIDWYEGSAAQEGS